MPALRTIDQQRAAFAWDKVQALKAGSEDYLSLVNNLPAMVQTNGLGQALAFLLVQKDAKALLYKHLQEWLCVAAPRPVYPAAPPNQQLISLLAKGDSLTLRRATLEVQALAVWLKRFAKARDMAAKSAPKASPETSTSETVTPPQGAQE